MVDYDGPIPDSVTQYARTHYKRLKGRGQDDKAEELASLSISEQKQFVQEEVRDFDPEHDDPANQEYLRIKHAYDALRELGHDDLAEELRTIIKSGLQLDRAREMVETIDADVDLITGAVEVVGAEESATIAADGDAD